ncbi:MAG TPA: hypothetical protein VHS58_13255 [Acetobacteraceae bacterium]|nr:hypothetical protein [Acetobacteraceae bacterium]
MAFLWTALLTLGLLASAYIGWRVRRRLHERHTAQDSIDSIRVLMGMLLTFSALVLGLLTSNAKQRFDFFNDTLSSYATDLIELDHRLRMYGPDVDDVRRELRAYTAAAIADSWPDEPTPAGRYPRFRDPGGVERSPLAAMLTTIDDKIEALAPPDGFHQQIAARMRNRMATVIQTRWQIIFSSGSTVSWPFLLVLTSWLAIIFAVFGMTSPPTRLIYTVVALSAVSIASPLYLIIDYSSTLTGLITLSSAPLRSALAHMDAAQEAAPEDAR